MHPQLRGDLEKLVSFITLLEYIDGMMSMNTHLKGVLVFRGVFDVGFLFLVEM